MDHPLVQYMGPNRLASYNHHGALVSKKKTPRGVPRNLKKYCSYINSGIFGQPELFDPKLTRHFLQSARRAHAHISSSWSAWTGMHGPACMNRHAWTGMHAACMLYAACMSRHAWTDMHEPVCTMLMQQLAAAACMRACVVARVIDTVYRISWFTARRRPGRGESTFRIEIFANITRGQKDELGTLKYFPFIKKINWI
jgi:hypothetical protein